RWSRRWRRCLRTWTSSTATARHRSRCGTSAARRWWAERACVHDPGFDPGPAHPAALPRQRGSTGVGVGGRPACPGALHPGVASLQCLEPQPLRTGVVAQTALLVFLVLAVVALEELHVAVALEGEDVGGDAVQ